MSDAPAPDSRGGVISEPASQEQEEKKAERLDEEGLPIDRAPTLDDVRGGEGSGRSIAVSCTVIVVLFVIGFWILRGLLLR